MKTERKDSSEKAEGKMEKSSDNSAGYLMEELYYSHLLNLLFDHGSESAELRINRKIRTNKKTKKGNKIIDKNNKIKRSKK